ncbi:hypothetical protein [Hydrogenobaculum acidophilum]
MNKDTIAKAIKDITKELELSEPSGFMLSYDFNDIWIDISLEKNEYGEWDNKIYTISISKQKAKNFTSYISKVTTEIYEDSERIYAQLTEEEWNSIQDILLDII